MPFLAGLKSVGRLLRDRTANVAVIWALSASCLIALTGLGLDYSRAITARRTLQDAVDGAVLAAARLEDADLATRKRVAEEFFRASITDLPGGEEATFSLAAVEPDGFRASTSMDVDLTLSRLISDEPWSVAAAAEALESGLDIELALILDTTGSMAGTRIEDLKTAAKSMVETVIRDAQTPRYSKIALVPYSMGVNAGSYATAARGSIVGAKSITNASWQEGATRNITGATKANPVVITSNGHGFAAGDVVYISGVTGMTNINNKYFTVGTTTSNTFQLQGVNGSSYSKYKGAGIVRKCRVAKCEVVVTAENHELETNDYVFITGVNGMTQINLTSPDAWQVTKVSADAFSLKTTLGPSYSAYTGGGSAFCVKYGCTYMRFNNGVDGTVKMFQVSTCTSERTGANAYTDVSPTTARLGINYPAPSNPCPGSGNAIIPLTTSEATLKDRIDDFTASGSTAGHTGVAWGWYLLSPSWGSLFPSASAPAAYNAPHLMKVAVLMTDGEYNSSYCNGVISQSSTNGSGSASDHINCNAPNGSSFSQAERMCEEMKEAGVVIFTVGFDLIDDDRARSLMTKCASGDDHYYSAADGAALISVFNEIAEEITQLRISK